MRHGPYELLVHVKKVWSLCLSAQVPVKIHKDSVPISFSEGGVDIVPISTVREAWHNGLP